MRENRSIVPGAAMKIDVGMPKFMSDGEKDEGMFAFNPNARVSSVRVGKCPIAVTVADDGLLPPPEGDVFGRGLKLVADGSHLYLREPAQMRPSSPRPFF